MWNGKTKPFRCLPIITIISLVLLIPQYSFASVSDQINTGIDLGKQVGTDIFDMFMPSQTGHKSTSGILSAFGDTMKKIKDLFFSFHHLTEVTATEGSQSMGIEINPAIITLVSVGISGIIIFTIVEKLWRHWWKFVIILAVIVVLASYLGYASFRII